MRAPPPSRSRTALNLCVGRNAQKFHDLATSGSDSSDQLFGERMLGVAQHFVGEQISARRHLEHVLAHYAAADHGRDVVRFRDVDRFGTDLRVSARAFLARVLRLQGFSDQAVRTAEMSVAEAQATGRAMSLCYALCLAACPIALWVGNLAGAARHAGVLLDHSRRHGLPLWSAFGSRFQIVVDLKRGDIDTALRLLPPPLPSPNLAFGS